MASHSSKALRLLSLAVSLALALVACEPETPIGPGPRAWIDLPADGETVELGTVIVTSHSTNYIAMPGSPGTLLANRGGITEISLYVNGALIRTDLNPRLNHQGLVRMEQPWVPSAPGEYLLQVRAKNTAGASGESIAVRVLVGVKPTATNTPTRAVSPQVITITPTFTPVLQPPAVVTPPTPTATATTTRPIISVTPQPISPTHTRTFTPPAPPPPVCSGTPNIASFSASPTQIAQGESSVLSWGNVTNADSVFLGSDGVASPGSRLVAPTVSTTYTLTARCGSNTQTRQVTVFVATPIPPSLTPTRTPTAPPPQPPAAPSGLSTKTNSCTSTTFSVTLNWKDNATNETGYRVYRNGALVATLSANSTSYTFVTSVGTHSLGVEAYNSAGASARPTISATCFF